MDPLDLGESVCLALLIDESFNRAKMVVQLLRRAVQYYYEAHLL